MHRFATIVLAIATLSAPSLSAQVKQPAPAGDIPKGTVTKYTFDQSKIFPGTTRDYWVYVPRQYDGTKPACVYVNQDGVQFNAPQVFDKLIASGDMPVTVGVFVMHGRVKAADGKAALDRFNRSYEYDGLGDAYARFLLDELLPHVEKEHSLKLSKNGNDRAIGGASSGAICAFTAAWERPDAFTRVFSAIGTYVGLRGGNEYPTLIRKVEPKPIRIFLQDGSKDQNIYGGDWWMANQEMQRALAFAGYEVNHEWGDGGHNGDHATRLFPEATKWLWKDWPAPVKAGAGSPQLKEILIPGENWQLVGEGYQTLYGAAVNKKGEVFFSDVFGGKTYRIDVDGKVNFFPLDSEVGQIAFGPDGLLYGFNKQGKLGAWDAQGKPSAVPFDVKAYSLVVRGDGGKYLVNADSTFNSTKIWFVNAKGEVREVESEGPRGAHHVALSPDQSLLYLAQTSSHWVHSYQVQPDGTLLHRQKYYHLHVPDTSDMSGAGGMCVDRDGRLYVATNMGIQVCDQAGRVNCIIPVPGRDLMRVVLGGANFDTLYACCGDKVYKRKLKVKGANAWDTPNKPAAPRL